MLRRLGGLAVLLLLLSPLSLACGQLLHAQMLVWGGEIWPGYALSRSACVEPEPPPTPGTARQAPVSTAPGARPAVATAAGAGDEAMDEALDDLDDDTSAAKKPGTASDDLDEALDELEEASERGGADEGGATEAVGDDLDEALDEPGAQDQVDEQGNEAPAGLSLATAPSAGEAPAGPAPDEAGGPAVSEPTAPPTAAQLAFCRAEHAIAGFSEQGIGFVPTLMVLLLLASAFIATARREHVSLRSARTPLEDRVSNAVQLAGNLLVAASAWHMRDLADAGAPQTRQLLWVVGMVGLALLNALWIIKPVRPKEGVPTGLGRAVACIPLYSWMAVISGLYFLIAEHHPAGIAIYLNKITEFSILYIQVGLYLWTGMLLRDTRLGKLFFDLLRPLELPPDLFAVLVVALAAVPTAYSGASGILVLALGATIYTELRRSGASQQRSLAATAMSGSLGVVLPPCLLVVIVASLNLDVTTDELFHWGWCVFGVTTMGFLAVSFLMRTSPWRVSPAPGAGARIATAARKLVPYGVIALLVVVFFWLVLNAGLDEHTAPYVLPVAMLAIMPWDRRADRAAGESPAGRRETSLDSGTHIGALLMLMGLSACLGGVIERARLVDLFPHSMGSPLATMAMLMIVLVGIGMVMDPYGAVILVSVTLYPIAKENGIHPLNFWMTALVSFELGYLTPPVALNQLLARQVVQHLPAYDEDEVLDPSVGFWRRHERLVIPIAVLTATLLIVALGPILYGVRA